LIGLQNGFRVAVGEQDSKDTIAVIVIDNEDVIVARAGWGHKFTSEVHVGLTSGFHHGSIAKVGSFSIVNGRREGIRIRQFGG